MDNGKKITVMQPTDNSRLMLDTLDMIRQLPPDKQEMVLMQVFGMATMALMLEANKSA